MINRLIAWFKNVLVFGRNTDSGGPAKSLFSLNENYMYLGEKRVEIKKLTPKLWTQLFETVDLLPGLILQVALAPKDNFYSNVIAILNAALEEIITIISILTDIDQDYIYNNVGVDEMASYLYRTVQKNNLVEATKNFQRLLPNKEKR